MFARVVDINLFNRQWLMGTMKNCRFHFFHRFFIDLAWAAAP
jgi:hypothetical protein